MARRKDLTALAALGTWGYMLSKRGDKKDDKKTSAAVERRIAADKEASEEPKSIEEDSEEAANKRTERMLINPNAREFGEAGTSMTVSPSKKPAASPAKPSPAKPSSAKPSSGAAKNLTASESQAARNALGEGSYRQDSVYNADKKGITSETRVPRFTPNEPPVQTHFGSRDEENAPRGKIDVTKYSLAERNKMKSERAPTDYRPVNERFKRGGKVKKMASGGMTSSSASKRADGIATKGKTRGKIC
jgi:hypothetical protein